MKKPIITILIIVAASSCIYAQSVNDSSSEKAVKMDSIMNSYLIHSGKRPVHNFMLYAKHKKNGMEVHKGVGIIGRNEKAISADFQFKIASITKTFVATVALQLVEEGKLKLNDDLVYVESPKGLGQSASIHRHTKHRK